MTAAFIWTFYQGLVDDSLANFHNLFGPISET